MRNGDANKGNGVHLCPSEAGGLASESSLAAAFADASDSDVRAFLLAELQRDERMAARFVARFGSRDISSLKKHLRSELAAVRKEYARGGFIDYRGSWKFECDYRDVLEACLDPAASRGDADALFALLEVAVLHFRGIRIDDSNGFVASTMNMLREYWERAFSVVGDEDVPKRISQLTSLVDKIEQSKRQGDFDWFIVPELRFLPVRVFGGEPRFASLIIRLIDTQLLRLRERAEIEHGEQQRRWPNLMQRPSAAKTSSKYEAYRWARARMEAMEALGEALEALRKFASPYFDDSDMLVAFADACARAGRPQEAAADLEEALCDPRLGAGGADAVRVRLLDVYEACGMDEKLRDSLRSMLQAKSLPFRGPCASELLKRYRSLFDSDQWEREREALFGGMANRYTLCDCLLAEGMPERIRELALRDPGFDVGRYQEALLQLDAPLVVAWHQRRIMGEFAEVYDRKGYRKCAKELVELAKLSDDVSAAQQVARDLRSRYPRKTSLHDELAKAGF